MNRFTLVLVGLLFSGTAAQATNISCAGDYFVYHITLNAKSVGTKVVGKIHVVLNNGTPHAVQLKPTASDIRAGQYLHLAGTAPQGSGTLVANFDAPTGTYKGTLSANTTMGSGQVPVVCRTTGRGFTDLEFMWSDED